MRNSGIVTFSSLVFAGLLYALMVAEGDTGTTTWTAMSPLLKLTLVLWWVVVVVFLLSFAYFFYQVGRGLGGWHRK
jgi:hypothetical protein